MQPQHPPSHSRQPSSRFASRQNSLSLANLQPTSFATFRAQNSQVPSPVRRKPLPGQSSPQTARYSSAEFFQSHKPDERHSKRSQSVDSPTLPGLHHRGFKQTLPSVPDPGSPRDASSPVAERYVYVSDTSLAPNLDAFPTPPSSQPSRSRTRSRTYSKGPSRHDIESDSEYGAHDLIFEEEEPAEEELQTMPNYYGGAQTALDVNFDDILDEAYNPSPQSSPPRKLKSPSGKLTSFFGWNKPRQSSLEDQSSTTTFSERSASPTSSPMNARQNVDSAAPTKSTLTALDIPKANASGGSYFNVPGTPLLSLSPHMNAHVEELERELKHISSELAESIRREMELEDEVERWKNETPNPSTERRTSDYYSDSGASSARFPFGDSESRLDELEKLRRKAEQEKAQIRSDMASRVQEELRRRRDLEAQVQQLEEQHGSQRGSQDLSHAELHTQLEDAKRRLVEEKQVKENFEDLLSALQKDLELHRNERDNLRDEVVPALKARVEGLEAQAAESQGATYEMTRMQQEMAQIKKQRGFRSIAEEEDGSTSPGMGLSRSNSLARHSVTGGKRGSLSRSNSVKELAKTESKEVLSERVKDIEEQRDALHRALKHLIIRQEAQAKEHSKRVRILEMERDAALNASPSRTAFHKEVTNLRDEVNMLRRRADDALDQKWQVEKGLGGLKMDLDRAQQETSSLRQVLQEHDISVPVDALPLDKAFQELQTTHALSIARIREMNAGENSGNENALELLIQSISDAEAERDAAQTEAERYRNQARALQQSEVAHLSKEQSLASDLYAAAQRMDELSSKVEKQLSANKSLRARLTNAVARGDEEQKSSAARIVELERKLKAEEDLVMSAQSQSDDVIGRHEDEVKALKESYGAQLQRMKSGLKSPAGQPSPLSPLLLKSPRLDKTSSGPGMSFNDAAQADGLEKKVKDLEKALRDADREMSEVVGRMNKAQIEVFELQTERDEAMRQTKKLQAAMQAEREKVKALMGG